MADITVNGNKKLKTLQKEFSKKFPYLFLGFIVTEDLGKNVNVRSLDNSKTISEVRTKQSNEPISLHGRTMIKNMESKFMGELGIAVQIAVKDYLGHSLYFPIGDFFNGLSLTKANEWAMVSGTSKIADVDSLSELTIF